MAGIGLAKIGNSLLQKLCQVFLIQETLFHCKKTALDLSTEVEHR
jgi:hypothetical protein